MNHVDLTSGIGGFALAARWVGWQTVGFCEIEPYCQSVLRKHWPEVPIHDDVRTLTPDIVRGWLGPGHQPAVLTAGYPCQPFSIAGSRKGEKDPRHLWPWIGELVAGLGAERPRWCVFENVAHHVRMGLDRVSDDLELVGYACWSAVIPAAGVGALHKRERVWIVCRDVADANGAGRREHGGPFAVLPQHATAEHGSGERAGSEVEPRVCRETDGFPAELDRAGGVIHDQFGTGARDDARPVDLADEGGRDDGRGDGLAGAGAGRAVAFDPLAWFGCGREYEVPLTINDHVPDRVSRLRALGNAIVPQVAYVLFQAIQAAEESA